MKLEQIKYFTTIVESGSFSRAAKNLYISQPALTASMKAMEEELQISLFTRTNQGTYPTEIGMKIYADCKDILSLWDEKLSNWSMLAQSTPEPEGIVYLAAIPAVCTFIVNNILFDFQHKHPKIRLSTKEFDMEYFLHKFSQERINIGITAIPISNKEKILYQYEQYNFEYMPLMHEDYCFALSTQNPLSQKDILEKLDLKQLVYLTYSYTTPSSLKFLLSDFCLEDFKDTFFFNSNGNVLQAVSENRGCTAFLRSVFLNNWYVKNGFICTKNLKDTIITPSEHHLVWKKNVELSSAEKVLLEYLQNDYPRIYQEALEASTSN